MGNPPVHPPVCEISASLVQVGWAKLLRRRVTQWLFADPINKSISILVLVDLVAVLVFWGSGIVTRPLLTDLL